MIRSCGFVLGILALWAGTASAQEKEDLTPEKAMQMLKEVRELQELAAELLNASSQGKSLETEKALLEQLQKLLQEEKSDPESAQKKILEKIERLMGKSEGNQKDAADKMGEIIRKAKSGQGQGKPGEPKPGQPKNQPGQPQKADQPSSPAKAPYPPDRQGDAMNKFRSIPDRFGWGHLPPRLREAFQHGKREMDDYPPEFQQLLKEYFERMLNDN